MAEEIQEAVQIIRVAYDGIEIAMKVGSGGKFFCNTIEDAVRELPATCPDTPRGRSCTCKEKVYSKTAIPAGTYKVTLQYSPKYKKKMPYLHDVPHFLGILIHSGNTEGDSAGCIIVGKNTVKGKVLESRTTFQKLYAMLESERDITDRKSVV